MLTQSDIDQLTGYIDSIEAAARKCRTIIRHPMLRPRDFNDLQRQLNSIDDDIWKLIPTSKEF